MFYQLPHVHVSPIPSIDPLPDLFPKESPTSMSEPPPPPWSLSVTPPTQHPMSSEDVIFFPVYYKLINFKLVHSYNVKYLTCIIFCNSGLQKIYKLHIWKCSTFTIFTLLTKETKIHIYTLDQMVFQWVPSDVLTLTADADCPVLWFPLLYLHG